MTRIACLCAVLIALALLAGTAQARSVQSAHVRQTRQQVVAYWTAQRMQTARPAARHRDAFSKPVPAAGKKSTVTASQVPAPYTTFPTSTNGKVFFTERGVNYVCSGTAISSANHSVVWTAGHCVNEGPGAYVTNWAFVPAYRDGAAPYGTWPASSLYTTTGWQTAGDFSFDLGAAVVAPASGGATLTATVGGGRVLAFSGTRAQQYQAFGYPAAGTFNGQRLWMCDAPLYTSDTSLSPPSMGIQCNLNGGSSGGGWVGADGRVYSVNSYGYSNLRNVMFGPYQGAVAGSLFSAAETATP